jgi:hypothetical protein
MKRIKNVIEAQDSQRSVERMARAKQAERNDLLGITQCFIAKNDKQDPAKVTAFAERLLAWLDESVSDLDRSARRAALNKVEAASWNAGLQGISTSELIEQASVYYRFLAA